MELDTATHKKNILVYKSYGGLGDIFFTVPSLYMLKDKFQVTFATQPRLVSLFENHLENITVVDENKINSEDYDEVIELGNYPWFQNDLEKIPQLRYLTHKKVKQHAIEHYKDGIINVFPDLEKSQAPFPFFVRKETSESYYTVHPGAGFLLKAWPLSYYEELMSIIHNYFPELTPKVIVGPEDPNPEKFLKTQGIPHVLVTGNIDEVADEVAGALFHVGNDSGITHLAGAFNTPILTIYGPTGPGCWGAFAENVELIWGKKGHCATRCNYEVIINCEDRVCLSNTKPDKMFFHLLKLLNRLYPDASGQYYKNRDFQATLEDESIVFQGKENEYLLEIHDEESRDFMLTHFDQEALSIGDIPEQLGETFNALLQLHIYRKIPLVKKSLSISLT
ncbi:glycosyltransferase family 9 protein [Aureisphaera galaxeae]|uniref:glycosyltransferase family 9 protein n=1 Tax=Aureisphaera galaxeae TaxID=1538023 RepID=UPI002350B8A5|nr:glycosyltransferase family 9 protein [Aureisphaera galaxeae]MDC8003753.1 glycosyltransferase family 9 protein [Aureisphaera galaxeae]